MTLNLAWRFIGEDEGVARFVVYYRGVPIVRRCYPLRGRVTFEARGVSFTRLRSACAYIREAVPLVPRPTKRRIAS